MLDALRKQVSDACHLAYKHGLTDFTWGSISGFDRANSLVVIKPKHVFYEDAEPEDMIVADLGGRIAEGGAAAPEEQLAAHIALYKAFPTIGGIVHTHSPSATSWAQAGRDIPPYGITHAKYFRGAVPCTRSLSHAEIETGYEERLGTIIAEMFESRGLDPTAIPGALVFNHGPFVWGPTCEDAVKNAVILEIVAKMAMQTEHLNPEIMPIPKAILEKQEIGQF